MDSLTTERLILRKFTGTDWRAVHEIFSHQDVARYTYAMDAAQSRDWVTRRIKQQYRKSKTAVSWAITLREQERLIGYIELAPPLNIGRVCVPGELALEYALHRSFWGRGYMTEAAREMIDFAFETLQVPQLAATCETSNIASAQVLEKAGLVYAATFEKLEPGFVEVPHHRYEIDKARYETEAGHGSFLD